MELKSRKKAKPSVTYETRYKHKLNMLGPETVMLNGNIKRIDPHSETV